MSRRTKKEVMAMYNVDPHCHWCGRLMKFYEIKKGEKIPDDQCTVDHLYHVLNPIRQAYKKKHTPSPVVLACLHCNEKRGNEDLQYYLNQRKQNGQRQKQKCQNG
jgi:hypothetical protein